MNVPRLRLRIYVKDRTKLESVRTIPDLDERRRQLYDAIDDANFQKLVVFNGFMGFFAGAYQIFAIGATLPFIKLAYYNPLGIPNHDETLLRTAMLLGTLCGQLISGFLADLYGRRKMYGYELMVLVLAIVGVSLSSTGQVGSMSLFGWLFTWRLLMGLGVGADYPLSATIACEFAPTEHRARMISTVFYGQPLGYLFAGLITLCVLYSHRGSIPNNRDNTYCDESCHQALDNCWRIIVGIGAIPALIAVVFRRTIPESPLYTADVLNRPREAEDDVASLTGQIRERVTHQNNAYPLNNLPSHPPQADPNNNMGPFPHSGAGPAAQQGAPIVGAIPTPVPDYEEESPSFAKLWQDYWRSFHEYFITEGHGWPLVGVSAAWFFFDTAYYALVGSSAASTAPKLWKNAYARCTVPQDWEGKNSTDYLLEHPFLAVPNCQPGVSGIYGYLVSTTAEVLLILCLGKIIGGALMIRLIKNHSPRRIQATGFLCLFFIFLIAGVILSIGSPSQAKFGGSMMLVLAAILFEFGPNFTTFIFPVELFKTSHRAFAHGIAAATGKAGAVLFQIYVQYATFGKHHFKDEETQWLGYTVLIFMPAMLLGLIVTVYLIPETRNVDGSNQRLEELQKLGVRAAPSDRANRRTHLELWASAMFLPSSWR